MGGTTEEWAKGRTDRPGGRIGVPELSLDQVAIRRGRAARVGRVRDGAGGRVGRGRLAVAYGQAGRSAVERDRERRGGVSEEDEGGHGDEGGGLHGEGARGEGKGNGQRDEKHPP